MRVHVRGRYDRLGEVVPRGSRTVVRVADPPTITAGSGRKELADWLTRPDHPLTARVIVNRVWQHHFGEGLVRTPSNFGTLGEPPTHPELLDYLAATFVADGWSLKKLHRRILLSATYQQSRDGRRSDAGRRPGQPAAGADTRGGGWRPRRSATACSPSPASSTATRGGPAVRDFNAPRRTLYLMTIRSDRTGFGPLFDAADPTAPVDKRTVSTVAPQALFLLNHPFVEGPGGGVRRPGPEAQVDRRRRGSTSLHRIAFGRAADGGRADARRWTSSTAGATRGGVGGAGAIC